jgi:tRNA dimethylallyltransferase
MSLPEVLAVYGPTASGKTAVAERLAAALETEVVSADAMQLYDGLPILTNQPGRPARLVAVWPLSHEGSVAEYAELAHAAIDELVERAGTAVVAGGTGLYLRAALADLRLPPAPAEGTRSRWEEAYDADPERAFAELRHRDPRAAELVHPNDRRRVVRALELAEVGASLSPEEDRLWATRTRRPTLVAGLDVPRHLLERRIEERTHEMFERGVVEEVRRAQRGSISGTAEKMLGLREIATLGPDEAREAVVRRTLRYAAYQRKWMRRIPGIVMIEAGRSPAEVADAILEVARAR